MMMDIDRAIKVLKEEHEHLIQLLDKMPVIKQVLKEFDGKVINKRLQSKLRETTGICFIEKNNDCWYYLEAFTDYQFRFKVLWCNHISDISNMAKVGNYRLDYRLDYIKTEKMFNEQLDRLKKEKELLEYSIKNYANVYKKIEELNKEVYALKRSLHSSVQD